LYPTGEARNVHRKKKTSSASQCTERRGLTPDRYTSHAQQYRFFYLTSCEDWTAMEDSSQESFMANNSTFCIMGAVMGFLNSERVK